MRVTDEDLDKYQLMHDHGGGPWVMVENLDSEYCRIASEGGPLSKGIARRAYLAWKPKLSVHMVPEDLRIKDSPYVKSPIGITSLPDLELVRDALRTGKATVKETRITGV